MKDLFVIDTHMHLYHSEKAGRGLKSLTSVSEAIAPGFECNDWGTYAEAIEIMDRGNIAMGFAIGGIMIMQMRDIRVKRLPADLSEKKRVEAEREIDQFLIERVKKQNRLKCLAAKENPRLIPFIYVDAIMGADGIRHEIRECVQDYGAKGVGEIAANHMGWSLLGLAANDAHLYPIWETCTELDVYVLPHFGPSIQHPVTGEPITTNNAPVYDDVLAAYPKLKMVELHMNTSRDARWGVKSEEIYQSSRREGIDFANRHPQVVCDIGSNLGYRVPVEDLVELIREVGPERVIWGSDYPWINPIKEVETLMESDLTEKELRGILGENAVRIFDIEKV